MSKPALKDAYLRIDRASEHLSELKTLNAEICAAEAKSLMKKIYPQRTIGPLEMTELMDFQVGQTPVPDRYRLLVGDTAISLRSALNYLVGQLAWLDSGSKKKGTQFPIEDAPNGFKGRKGTYLHGINVTHIAKIESLQPYSGCNWTVPLRRLSNLDKHDELVTVMIDCLVTTETTVEPANGGLVNFRMKMDFEPKLRVTLGDLPIIETLEMLQSQVTQTLDAFKPEFK